MKIYICLKFAAAVAAAAVLSLVCCRDLTPSGYDLAFPPVPEGWGGVLGEPHWRVQWLDPGGNRRIADISPPEKGFRVEIPVTWANAVTAWPYWPEHNLYTEAFKPAGALFPFDVSGNSLHLSWEAGPDTVFYWEMAYINDGNAAKIPANFDWVRFRELFQGDMLSEAVKNDPWVVDWAYVAERTVNANFDRRRLVPQAVVNTEIPVPGGLWYGSSPFGGGLYFAAGEAPVFPVRAGLNVWVSAEGILRCSGKAWMFVPIAPSPCIR
jgi:hypothetical protein